jgi:hypothetical protein
MKRAMPIRVWDKVKRQMEKAEEQRMREREMATCSVCGAPCRRDGEGIWHHSGPCEENQDD